MSKSVLVIDTPENCYDCPFGTSYCGELEYEGYCELADCLDYDVILMTEEHYDYDYMKFVPVNNSVSGIEKGDCYCYEVKSSAEDFRSGHGLNFIGDYNYLVMPTDVCAAVSLEIPHYVGIYVPEGNELICAKKAKRANRARPVSEILLMMFRSANRDYRKTVKKLEEMEK